ncbi:MAG: glutamine amidotransferase [Pirellulales bacterium]
MNELRLHPVMDPLAIAIVVLALCALMSLRPKFGSLSRGRWAALVGLRLAVILLTLIAMLRPELVYTKQTPQRASLVLLVDDSRSMQVADSLGDASRWDALKSLLTAAGADLEKLSETWDTSVYRFDTSTAPLQLENGEIDLPKEPTGEQSAIGAAVNDVLDRHASGRVLGVLLMSDGAQRAAAPNDLPPQVAVRRMAAENIPLYTFAFGKSGGSDRADLAIDDLVTNETIFAEAPTEVRGQLLSSGFANQRVAVQLLWENAERKMDVVDTVQLDTASGGESQPVRLTHTPQMPGEYKVTLRVEPREGELVTTNNEASTFVTVRKGGIKVLYLAGAKRIGGGPGPEQRFVRAALAQSPDIVVERRLLNYQPPEIDLRDVFKSGDFDVVILDDVDARALSLASWQALAEMVRGGAGLMMTGGFHSFGPGGFRETPLADVLPIDIGPAQRQGFDEPLREDVQIAGPLKLQPAAPLGVNHPVLQLGDGGEATAKWSDLPPLDGANLFERRDLKPNAAVLAEADDARRHPLLVAGQPGDGRVLAFAGDSTWRWQMQGFGEAHRRFWRQAVLWLAKKDEQTEGQVWIKLAGRRVMRGTRVDFTLGAKNSRGEPLVAARPTISIDTPDGRTLEVRPTKSGDHWSAVFRETDKPGDYRIKVTASDGPQAIGTAEARFLVPDQDIELDRPAAEPSLMAQLAEMTAPAGGKALAPEELPTLLANLAAEPPKLLEEVVAKTTYWDTWPFFLLFVALLGTEWYLRKRWGLV